MPELPEVETVCRGLAKTIVGHSITGVQVLLPKTVLPLSPETFAAAVTGHSILSIGRRGKYLLIYLSAAVCLVSHLRMTGHFSYVHPAEPLHPYTRIILDLDGERQLRFMDMRTFGTMQAVPCENMDTITGLAALGPEPLSADFTLDWLAQKGAGRKISVKGLLLDQRTVAGIGNIYADESLFAAGIHPIRPAESLSRSEWQALWQAIQESMTAGIAHRGTSVQNYQNLDGRPGEYQHRLQVYQKTGEPCLRCHTPIEKIRVAGRGTHYCPRCQPRSPSSGKRRR